MQVELEYTNAEVRAGSNRGPYNCQARRCTAVILYASLQPTVLRPIFGISSPAKSRILLSLIRSSSTLYRLAPGNSQAHLKARVEGAVFWLVRVGHGPGWKCMEVEDQGIAGAEMNPRVPEEMRIEEHKATACLLRATTQRSISFLNSTLG